MLVKCQECSTQFSINMWSTMKHLCGKCYLEYKKEIREGKRNRLGKMI